MKVRLLPRAQRDLGALPEEIQDQVIEALELLKDFSRLGAAMIGAFQGYRALLACRSRYRIIYRIVSQRRVDVAYIRQAGRQTGLRII